MLTVMHLKNSADAISKYLKNGLTEADDTEAIAQYYGTDNSTFWVGGLADDFNLTGQPVDDETFQAMLNGTLPDGTGPAQMHERNRRMASDFTFSAPKSVSILALAMGKTELIEDHNFAVVKALEAVQERLIYARRGKGGLEHEYAPRVAIAVFQHIDSRPVQGLTAPDLHSHAIIPNIGRRADGTLGGIQVDMGDHADLLHWADAVYKSTLAGLLRKRNIALRPIDNGFEIASIDRATIEAWSPRKEQIDALLKSKGTDRASASAGMRQWANLLTREKKEGQSRAEYIRHWQEMAKAQGLRVSYALPSDSPPPSPKDIAANAFNHLAERQDVFRQPALQTQALLLGCAHHDREALERAAQDIADQNGIALEGERLTSYQHVASNAYILGLERQCRDTVTPLTTLDRLSGILTEQEARQGFQFSADQREAIRSIATSKDAVQLMIGAAGAGKTTSMSAICQIAKDAGVHVVGLAPSHVAKEALAASLKIEGETLAKWLQSPKPAKGPRLIVLDESGMVSTSDMAALFASLAPQDRLLLVGDARQLAPISAGQPFAELLEQRPDAPMLGEVRRQHDIKQREIATLYSQGRGQEAARLLLDFAQEIGKDQLIEAAAQAYISAEGSKVLLTSKNATVNALNSAIAQRLHGDTPSIAAVATVRKLQMTKPQRERMSSYPVGATITKLGEVRRIEHVEGNTVTTNRGETLTNLWDKGWDVCEVEALDLWEGDPVLATSTMTLLVDGKPTMVRNGTVLTVMGAGPDGGAALVLPDGRVGFTDPYHAVPLAYGWARSIHRSQGSTVDHAIVVDDDLKGDRLSYVASSRQRLTLTVLTADKASLADRLADWGATAPMTPARGSENRLAVARQESITYAQKQAAHRRQAAAAAEAERRQAEAEAAKRQAEAQQAPKTEALTRTQPQTETEIIQVETPQPAVYWVRRP